MRSVLGGNPTTLRVVDVATVAVVVGWLIGASGLLSLGAYRWKAGELERTYRASYEDVWNVAYDALQSLDMSVEDQKRNALMEMPYDALQSVSSQKPDVRKAVIMARRVDGVDFRVEIMYLTDRTTQVGVRAALLQTNLVGDRATLIRIHETIRTKLKSRQPLTQLIENIEG